MQTVLIDDDATSIFLTERLFEQAGLGEPLTSFISPVEAVAFLKTRASDGTLPQVILLDLNMPLMSGWDVLDAFRPQEAEMLGRCAVYILTSSLAPFDKVRAAAYPLVAGLLHKPLDQNGIRAIQAQVGGRAMEQPGAY